MLNGRTRCFDRPSLARLLDERIDEREEVAMREHLDVCESCRGSLDELVADADVWRELRRLEDDATVVSSDPASPPDHDVDVEMDRLRELLGPTDDPTMLGRLGRYEVCGLVGRGSTGIVLKALDGGLNRYVAIKVLSPSYASNGSARVRFDREGRSVAAVSHEHVVPVYAVEEYRGLPYIVMQYVPGGSLHKRIAEEGPLDSLGVVRLGLQIARGLAAAHAQGIVHRDVKPANVLLESRVGRAMVTDFGLARVADDAAMTNSGMIAGTPQYMSPEQASGESVDPRSDLFSLGSVLYTACTGRAPFRSDTVFGVLKRLCEAEARPIREINPEIEPWLAAFIDRLHAKSPNDRFDSANDVARILEHELAHLQNPGLVPAPPRPWLARRGRSTPARRLTVVAVASVALATVGLGAFGAGHGWFGDAGKSDPGSHAGGDGAKVASLAPKGTEKSGADRGDPPSKPAGSSDRSPPGVPRDHVAPGRPGEIVPVHGSYTDGVVDGYSLYLPESYAGTSDAWPMIVFLTGGCGVGGKIEAMTQWGVPELIKKRKKRSRKQGSHKPGSRERTYHDELLLDTFVVVAPHMTEGAFADRQFYDQEEAIREILDEAVETYRVDESRIYMAGVGRGGHGTWGLASRMSDRLAAVAMIRGETAGVTDWAALASLPMWVAHNAYDKSVEYDDSAEAVARIEAMDGGSFLRLESLDASGEDLTGVERVFTATRKNSASYWPDLFQRAELYDWLLQFRRSDGTSGRRL